MTTPLDLGCGPTEWTPAEPTQPAWDLDVFVPGTPTTKGSLIAVRHNKTGRAVAIPTNSKNQRAWQAYVRDEIGQVWDRGPTTAPVHVEIDFVMPRRKSAPKGRTDPHTRKPDGDKLERAVWDSLTTIVWADDAQVVRWVGSKREAELDETPGARIRVRTIA